MYIYIYIYTCTHTGVYGRYLVQGYTDRSVMCVCVCVCMYVYVCMCLVCMHTHIYSCTHTRRERKSEFVSGDVHGCVACCVSDVYISHIICVCVCVCVCVSRPCIVPRTCIYVFVCVCTYMFVCVCIHV